MHKSFPECKGFPNFEIFYDLQADEIISQMASDPLGIKSDHAAFESLICAFSLFVLTVVSLIIKN